MKQKIKRYALSHDGKSELAADEILPYGHIEPLKVVVWNFEQGKHLCKDHFDFFKLVEIKDRGDFEEAEVVESFDFDYTNIKQLQRKIKVMVAVLNYLENQQQKEGGKSGDENETTEPLEKQ